MQGPSHITDPLKSCIAFAVTWSSYPMQEQTLQLRLTQAVRLLLPATSSTHESAVVVP